MSAISDGGAGDPAAGLGMDQPAAQQQQQAPPVPPRPSAAEIAAAKAGPAKKSGPFDFRNRNNDNDNNTTTHSNHSHHNPFVRSTVSQIDRPSPFALSRRGALSGLAPRSASHPSVAPFARRKPAARSTSKPDAKPAADAPKTSKAQALAKALQSMRARLAEEAAKRRGGKPSKPDEPAADDKPKKRGRRVAFARATVTK